MNDFEKLAKILETVKSSDTLTDVAEKLFFSQPYISKLLKQKEQAYRVVLVHRSTTPIELTLAGQAVLNDLNRILSAQRVMAYDLDKLQRHAQNQLTIAICPLAESQPLSQIAVALHHTFPEQRFRLLDSSKDVNEQELLDGSIDILVGQRWSNPLFHIEMLNLQELALLLPDTCPLYHPGQDYVDYSEDKLSALNDCEYVSVSNGSFLQIRVDELFSRNNIVIHSVVEVPNSRIATQTALKLHATTITSTKIAHETLSPSDNYNLMRLPSSVISLDVGLSYLKSSSANVKQIAEFLKNIVGENTDEVYAITSK